jgi:hypothetical protein
MIVLLGKTRQTGLIIINIKLISSNSEFQLNNNCQWCGRKIHDQHKTQYVGETFLCSIAMDVANIQSTNNNDKI